MTDRNNADDYEEDRDRDDRDRTPYGYLSDGGGNYEGEEDDVALDDAGGAGEQELSEKISPKCKQFVADHKLAKGKEKDDGDERNQDRSLNDLSNACGSNEREDGALHDAGGAGEQASGDKISPKCGKLFVDYKLTDCKEKKEDKHDGDAHYRDHASNGGLDNVCGSHMGEKDEALVGEQKLPKQKDLDGDRHGHDVGDFDEHEARDTFRISGADKDENLSDRSLNSLNSLNFGEIFADFKSLSKRLQEFSYDKIDEDSDLALNADVVSALRSNMIECDRQAGHDSRRKVRLAIAPPKRGSSLMSMSMGSGLCSVDKNEDSEEEEDDFVLSNAFLKFSRRASRQRSAATSLQGSSLRSASSSSLQGSSRHGSASSSMWESARSHVSNLSASLRRSAITADNLEEMEEEIIGLGSATKRMDWLRSFKDLDPRYQILEFFNDLSLGGVELFESNGCFASSSLHMPKILRGFIKSGIFSVWRPTSPDAIRKMITGEGTGKGLDIKGKSAKCGVYSGFVPFLQIHENAHKKRVGAMRKDKRVRVFYPNRSSRDTAATLLTMLGGSMTERAEHSLRRIRMEGERRAKMVKPAKLGRSIRTQRRDMFFTPNINSALKESTRCLMEDPTLYEIDDYAQTSGVYGLDIPEKLFWEGYVVPNDIRRDGQYETGRPSMPEFQQMNIETLRKGSDMFSSVEGADSYPVLWHGGCGRPGEEAPRFCNPMCPIDLLMAYEENGKVTPVVSDFDCFLLGTRGVKYHEPLGDQELSMLSWCVDKIEGVLETPVEGSSWTSRWLEVKKKHANDPAHGAMPLFGYADPRSYSIMKGAVHKLRCNGAVRHGPECFNYGFPQELDEQYLVISDTFDGIPWRYTNAEGLIGILCENIDKGFTFPLNPKWILCDPGWRRVYDNLMASQKPNVQDSLSIWYPESIRDRMDDITAKYPEGFIDTSESSDQSSGVRADLAQLELQRYQTQMRYKRKIRATLSVSNIVTHFAKMLEEQREKLAMEESIQPQKMEDSGCQACFKTDGRKAKTFREDLSAGKNRGSNQHRQIDKAWAKMGKGIKSKVKKSLQGDLILETSTNASDDLSLSSKSKSDSIFSSVSSKDHAHSEDGKARGRGAKPSPRQRPKGSKIMLGYLKKVGAGLPGSFQERRSMGQRIKK